MWMIRRRWRGGSPARENARRGAPPLDGVRGEVFTQDIEHTFEQRVNRMVLEVLL
jgi:hypothetical protein